MHLELMRAEEKEFPDVDWPSVTSARIWHCKYRSLAPVEKLENLQTLVVATWPDESFEVLRPLKRLRYLSVVHLPKVSSLDPLASLTELESLSLETLPSWDVSGKVQEVESVEPLAKLEGMRHLQLFGVRPRAGDLTPLFGLSLESARFSKNDEEAVQEFYRRTGASDAFNPAPQID